MPTFEFVCKSCGEEFLVRFKDKEYLRECKCPFCDSKDFRRKFSVPSIHFKGNGFYVTDNRKDKLSK
jgi:putative FmdB family regulatory protein